MGVLNCDRKGCDNVMCDRLSYEFGYICDRCFDELCEIGNVHDVVGFMATPPKPYDKVDMTPVFEQIFPISHGSPRYDGE